MSRELVKTDLPKFTGPINLVEGLRGVLESYEYEWEDLERACESIKGFIKLLRDSERPITADNYVWKYGLLFSISLENELVVLLPYRDDKKKVGGSRFDRSIAVYTRGRVSIDNIGFVLFELTQRLEKYFRSFGRMIKEVDYVAVNGW